MSWVISKTGSSAWIGSWYRAYGSICNLYRSQFKFDQSLTPTIELTQAQYSQQRETRADTTGLEVLHCSYGHVGGATEFFTTMAASEDESVMGHYFSSHPEMVERIEVLEVKAKENRYTFGETIPLSLK